MSITSSKNANTSHILGIDYGKAKIGLAVADSETRIAFGYGVLKNDKNLIKHLANIIEKEGIEKIIIGATNVETRQCLVSTGQNKDIQVFASLLEKLNIPIELQDEMFSTQQAERNLKEKGAKKIKRFDDQEAARIILQSWLEKK